MEIGYGWGGKSVADQWPVFAEHMETGGFIRATGTKTRESNLRLLIDTASP
jgi:hypothetical protein